QAEDGIRDATVTGVQTCALPISPTGVNGLAGGFPTFPKILLSAQPAAMAFEFATPAAVPAAKASESALLAAAVAAFEASLASLALDIARPATIAAVAPAATALPLTPLEPPPPSVHVT